MTEWVRVGRVGRPHGLDGAFVVEGASDDPNWFAEGATVFVAGEPARVVVSKRAGGRPVIKLDRPAERGAELAIPASDLPATDADTYYAFELVGLAVVEEGGRPLGRVTALSPGVANDVLELDSGLALPMVGACILEIDRPAERIVVARGFAGAG